MRNPKCYGGRESVVLRTEPPVDEITQLSVAQVVTARVMAKRNVGESEVRERRCGFSQERDRPVTILFAGREPRREASRTDAAGEDTAMQHRGVRETGAISRDVGRAAATTGESCNQYVRAINDEAVVGSHPLNAVQRMNEIGGHITLFVADLPCKSRRGELSRIRGDDCEATTLGEVPEEAKDIRAGASRPMQDNQKRKRP